MRAGMFSDMRRSPWSRFRPKPVEYPKPSLTADMVLIAGGGGVPLRVLLIRRGNPPFEGMMALPGGFAEPGESIEQTAGRELEEETGVAGGTAALCGVYSAPGRDPRGWVVSAGFVAAVGEPPEATPGDDAAETVWAPVADLAAGRYRLAFDHAGIVADGLAHPSAPAGAADWADRVRSAAAYAGPGPAADAAPLPPGRPGPAGPAVSQCGFRGCRHLVSPGASCAAGHPR